MKHNLRGRQNAIRTCLDTLALGYLPVATLVIELESVGVELQVLLLPRLQEGTSEFEHFPFDDAVGWSD